MWTDTSRPCKILFLTSYSFTSFNILWYFLPELIITMMVAKRWFSNAIISFVFSYILIRWFSVIRIAFSSYLCVCLYQCWHIGSYFLNITIIQLVAIHSYYYPMLNFPQIWPLGAPSSLFLWLFDKTYYSLSISLVSGTAWQFRLLLHHNPLC